MCFGPKTLNWTTLRHPRSGPTTPWLEGRTPTKETSHGTAYGSVVSRRERCDEDGREGSPGTLETMNRSTPETLAAKPTVRGVERFRRRGRLTLWDRCAEPQPALKPAFGFQKIEIMRCAREEHRASFVPRWQYPNVLRLRRSAALE